MDVSKIKTKEDRRDRIKYRIRKRVQGTPERPRLTVFRSVTHIYVQVVDDMHGTTIAVGVHRRAGREGRAAEGGQGRQRRRRQGHRQDDRRAPAWKRA